MNIGDRIKSRRINLGLTAEELAYMIGKSRATVYRYENGDIENMPTTVLEPLAEALLTTPGYLMGWEDNPEDYERIASENGMYPPNDCDIPVRDWVKMKFATDEDYYQEFGSPFDLNTDSPHQGGTHSAAYTNTATLEEFEKLVKPYRSLDDPGRAHVDTVLDWEVKRSAQLRQIQNENESLKLRLSQEQTFNRLLSYYGRIAAAGKSYGFEDMICGTIQVPLTDENQYADYAIGVNGNSMEPDYTGEDIVYVQKASHLNKGEIGIFQKDNCIYIKKVGDGVLLSINPDYGPIPGGDVKVLGRVLGKIEGEYKVIK